MLLLFMNFLSEFFFSLKLQVNFDGAHEQSCASLWTVGGKLNEQPITNGK